MFCLLSSIKFNILLKFQKEVKNMLKLKEIRENAGLQQRELATQLNRTTACISSWETGKTEPSLDDLVQLSNILKVSVDYLVNKTDEYGINKEHANFSPLEMQIINKLKQLNLEEKNQVLGFIKSFNK